MAARREANGGGGVIAGHFAFAAAVKSRERATPLWALMLACVWLDVVFVPLLLAGVERIVLVPGARAGYGTGIIYADYTHSLLGALVLSAVFGLIAAVPWGRRIGAVLGGVVFSHWLIDLIVHRADMPLLPGNRGALPRLGLGLWRVPAASLALELAFVLVGAWLYWRAAVATAQPAGTAAVRRANLVGGMIVAGGVAVLALDLAGV